MVLSGIVPYSLLQTGRQNGIVAWAAMVNRVKELHAALKITPAKEDKCAKVANIVRNDTPATENRRDNSVY
ncbi:hypothetical protein [Paraburkholderia sp. J76]|uniref:hypothetical protein n=1 Tax=Paraburkholderia sp. J76 TaxID=2805439 RepID=UPI002ABDAE50|nr:hypothetical protein [Paraburkholderia sp. J76]